jgi:5'-methylthioadenosine phosphorylase
MVAHVPLAEPASPVLRLLMQEIASTVHCKVHIGGTYLCIERPYFSTYADSLSYRTVKASVIGMTNFPEFALAPEAGIAYLPCKCVTDYDCSDQSRPHVTVEEVLHHMKKNNEAAFDMVPEVFAAFEEQRLTCETTQLHRVRRGLLTSIDQLTYR